MESGSEVEKGESRVTKVAFFTLDALNTIGEGCCIVTVTVRRLHHLFTPQYENRATFYDHLTFTREIADTW